MLTIHRKKEKGKKAFTYFVCETQKVTKLSQEAFDDLVTALPTNADIRVVNTGVFGLTNLRCLRGKQANIYTAHWHDLNLKKNMEASDIVKAFETLDASLFRRFEPRPDMAALNEFVAAREAIIKSRNAEMNRIRAVKQSLGFTSEKIGKKTVEHQPDWVGFLENMVAEGVKTSKKLEVTKSAKYFEEVFDWINQEIKDEEGVAQTPIEKLIELQATRVPEYLLLRDILGTEGFSMTAATVVAKLGDISRFATVAKVWTFCGYGDPVASKRTAGQKLNHDPELRKTLWTWRESMVKNCKKWIPTYKETLAKELEQHVSGAKCGGKPLNEFGGCGHCGNRARRKIVKEVLKQYWLAARQHHNLPLTQPYKADTAVGAAAGV
jgi:Transposase IS116/IS110/IS902 family